jgi:hypothetical protein
VKAARRDELNRQYELLFARHVQQEAKLWPSPALSLTALAFLFVIALAPESGFWARVVSGSLAALVSLASVQLMAKQYFVWSLQKAKLLQIERELGLEPFAGDAWNSDAWKREEGLKTRWHNRRGSRLLWQSLLGVFAIVAALIVVAAIWWPAAFD